MKNIMTDEERTIANLRKLREELPKVAKEKPHIIEDFDMKVFGAMEGYGHMNECETHGCLLGNAVHVFDWRLGLYDGGRFDYEIFEQNVFPDLKYGLSISEDMWGYLFSSTWGFTAYTTFQDAMDRIDFLLDHWDNWDEVQHEWNYALPYPTLD